MVDNIKDDSNEPKDHDDEFGEEFDFESEQHDDALAPENAELGEDVQELPPSAKPKSVILPLIIGVAVLGFIGWKVFDMLTAPKEQAKGGPKGAQIETAKVDLKSAPTTTVTTADPTQPKGEIPNLYEAEQQAKQAVSDEKITAILQKKIDEQFGLQKQQLEAMQKEASTAIQNANNANKTVSTLQQELATLSATVQDLSAQVKTIKDAQLAEEARAAQREAAAKAKPKSKPKAVTKSDASPNISVHAIIPGRAWLRTQDGKTITVSEGDAIAQYGKVLKIDAPNGLVITTSGVTLR